MKHGIEGGIRNGAKLVPGVGVQVVGLFDMFFRPQVTAEATQRETDNDRWVQGATVGGLVLKTAVIQNHLDTYPETPLPTTIRLLRDVLTPIEEIEPPKDPDLVLLYQALTLIYQDVSTYATSADNREVLKLRHITKDPGGDDYRSVDPKDHDHINLYFRGAIRYIVEIGS